MMKMPLPEDHDIEGYSDEQVEYRNSERLSNFWKKQKVDVEALNLSTEQEFKTHMDLPLARIKRIMKSDEDVRMISAEAPILFAKACEIFILEVTLRSWGYAEKNKRKTILKEDVETTMANTDIFDFLVNLPQT